MAILKSSAVTVLGNFAVDRVDGAAASPGGCPSFASRALRETEDDSIVARLADSDRQLFAEVLDENSSLIRVLGAETTSAFGLHYDGEERSMTVDAIGDPWTAGDIEAAQIDTEWVHAAALLRSDFPHQTLASLAGAGHRLSYDGQGLVRSPRLGEMELSDDYDRELLDTISVLKLNEEEAMVVGGGQFDAATAAQLGCPEIVVTLGSRGCDVYADGTVSHVPARPVLDIHATGAGDVFTVSYLVARASGAAPALAAERACGVVTTMLEDRRRESLSAGRSID
jgi:sugar/nucleoside kinase (ribokinase family)